MTRLTESNEASRRALQVLGRHDLANTLLAIHDTLWPRNAPHEVDWNADTMDRIAQILRDAAELVG
jgi:hypothetical protein